MFVCSVLDMGVVLLIRASPVIVLGIYRQIA